MFNLNKETEDNPICRTPLKIEILKKYFKFR